MRENVDERFRAVWRAEGGFLTSNYRRRMMQTASSTSRILTPRRVGQTGEEESMATATEKGYVFARLDELEPAPILAPGATDDGRQRLDIRRHFGITSFGVQAYRAPSGVGVIREHDEMMLGEAGQEELYVVLTGSATFEIDGDSIEATAGSLVHVPPAAKRKATTRE